MKFGTSLKAASLILAMFATQGAFCDPRGQSNARLIGYKMIDERTTIDPATGDTIITSYWQYDDGVKTTTTKRIPRGNEERQGEKPPRPEPRVID